MYLLLYPQLLTILAFIVLSNILLYYLSLTKETRKHQTQECYSLLCLIFLVLHSTYSYLLRHSNSLVICIFSHCLAHTDREISFSNNLHPDSFLFFSLFLKSLIIHFYLLIETASLSIRCIFSLKHHGII